MNKTAISKQLYLYGNQKLEYTLVKSKRRKTSEIIVDANEITLRIPFSKSINDVEKLMNSKIRWIIRKQKEYREQIPEIIKPNFLHGSTLPYLGKNYEIEIFRAGSKESESIKLIGGQFYVSISGNVSSAKIRSLYEQWILTIAQDILSQKVKQYSKLLNLGAKKVVIKNLKGRWGALTKLGGISLNANLIKAPEDVMDYIIIHELCHFIVKGHSHNFWKLVRSYFPRYSDAIKWLDLNSSAMI